MDVAEQVRLVVEVVEQRVLGLGITEDSRKENKKNGEKDHHPDRGQVEHSLTGDQAPQLLYQEHRSRLALRRRRGSGFQTCEWLVPV